MKLKSLILFLIPISVFAGNPAWKKLLKQTKEHLQIYDKLQPNFSNEKYFTAEELKIDASLLHSVQGESVDSIEEYDAIMVLQSVISDELVQIANHRKLIKTDLGKYFENCGLGISQSEDKKLYNFTLDAKMGGTYRSLISVIRHRDLPDSLTNIYEGLEDSNPYKLFDSDGYYSIHTFNTVSGTRYLLQGEVIGCSSCIEYYFKFVHLEQGRFVVDSEYYLWSRFGNAEVQYDDTNRIYTASYIADDMSVDCSCSDGEKEYPGNSHEEGEPEEAPLQNCLCVFYFDGLNFVRR